MHGLTCAVATDGLQVGEVLDVCGGAGHGQQSGEVGVGRVQREAQRSALEVDNGRMAGTFRSDTRAPLKRKNKHT